MLPWIAATLLLLAAPHGETTRISLRQGVVGGIRPAVERLRIDFAVEGKRVTVRMATLTNPEEPDPRKAKREVRTGTMERKELDALLKEIDPIWTLPVEDPKNGEDIYGLDTIVSVESGGKTWGNGVPSGCVHAPSSTRPTDPDKDAFRKIADRVAETARKHAVKSE